jgi:hypothetical protein
MVAGRSAGGAAGIVEGVTVIAGRGVDGVWPGLNDIGAADGVWPGLNDIGAADGVEPVHAATVRVPARAAMTAGMVRLMGQGPPFDSVLR